MSRDSDNTRPGIPSALHSTYSNAPFEACVDCETPLLDALIPYSVEKVVRQGEVVLEFAICMNCQARVFQEFSEESIERIREYASSSLDQTDEIDRLLDAIEHPTDDRAPGPPPPSALPERCGRCETTGEEYAEEHNVGAVLLGDRIVGAIVSLCGKCTDGLTDVLSRQTRDAHDDFIERNFPGVPSELDLPVGAIGL